MKRLGHTFRRRGLVSVAKGNLLVSLRIESGGYVRVTVRAPDGLEVDFLHEAEGLPLNGVEAKGEPVV